MKPDRFKISLVLAAAVGLGISFAFPPAMAMMAFLPVLVAMQTQRRKAFVSAFAYYFAAAWPMTAAARYFWGPDDSALATFFVWIGSSCVLALPWAAAWTPDRIHLTWRLPLASVATVLPPIGLIGWAHPLTATGLLFPGTAWLGLLLLVFGLPWLTLRPKAVLGSAALLSAAAYLLHPSPPGQLANWEAVDTHFGDVGGGPARLIKEFSAASWLQERALESPAQVILFPETAVPMWTDATELFWQQTLDELRASGKTIVLGAGLPRQARVDGTLDFAAALQLLHDGPTPSAERRPPTDVPYFNAVLVRGAQAGQFVQRIPVPFGMWRPWSGSGVPVNLFGPSVLAMGGQRAAVLVCYEGLLAWPVLQSMAERATLVLVIGNDHWDRGGLIQRYQRAAVGVWSRLFNVPHVVAINR